jgi:hypothetical protein
MSKALRPVHSAAEVAARYREARDRDVLGFEANEYLRVLTLPQMQQHGLLREDAKIEGVEYEPDSLTEIDRIAKDYLAYWLEKIEGERGISVCRATQHFTAWKWLLGHPDADTFPGSINGGEGGWYQRDAYRYIKQQIDSGEWDRLTAQAQARGEAQS